MLLSKKKILDLGKISLEFYLIHYLVIQYGMIVFDHLSLNKGIAVFLLTILFFAISVGGAYLIHFFSNKKNVMNTRLFKSTI